MACETTFKFSRQARQNLLVSAFSVPHFGQYITRPHMKTPARPEAMRVNTFKAGESRLPRQQRADVTQQLVGADRAVAVVFDQAVDDFVDAAQLVGVGRLGRSGDLHHVLEVGEDLLLDGLFQPLVRVVLEGLAFARIRGDADQDLLPESVLGVFGDADLLFDRAHQSLVWFELFLGYRVFDLLLVAIGLDVVEVGIAHVPRHLLERIDESALHLGLGDVVVFAFGGRNQIQVAFSFVRRDAGVLVKPVPDRAKGVDRVDAGDVVAHQGVRQPVDDVARRDAVHAFADGLFLQLANVLRFEAFNILAVVELHLLDDVNVGFLRLFEPGHDGEHGRDLQGVRRQVDVAQRLGLFEQFVINALFLGDLQVVGDFDHDDAVLKGFGLLVADEGVIFVLVGVRHDDFVGVDQSEPSGLDVLLLREGQQRIQKLLVDLQDFDELHHPAVGDVEFTVEAVGARVRLDTNLADRRQVDRAGQFGNVLALRVARGEGTDADAVFFGEDDALDQHVFVPTLVDMFEVISALWAELAFDVEAVVLFDLGP